MSVPFTRFGAFVGNPGGDVRVQIGGKGRKNVLAITASYLRSTILAPAANFQGRLVVVEGQITPLNGLPIPPDITVGDTFDGLKLIYNAFLVTVGPHPIFLPIAQQEGSPQGDEDSTVNIVLCKAQDGAGGVYIPSVSVSGQTVFGGAFAGQQTFGQSIS